MDLYNKLDANHPAYVWLEKKRINMPFLIDVVSLYS